MGILVAITDDGRFEPVLNVAVQLATGLEQKLHVTHITETETASNEERAFRDEIQAVLSERDVPVEISLEHLGQGGFRSGTAIGKQLIEVAEGVEINHVVLGHRSKDRLKAARQGHTDFVVAKEASVPVTIVPEGVENTDK
jgi:K+-sensing histidine kinase KdpD